MGVTKQEGVRAHSGAYQQLTHSVFMAVPPAGFLPGKSAKQTKKQNKKPGVVWCNRTPPLSGTPFYHPLRPYQPHPHSSWLRGIKGHSAARVWAGRGRGPAMEGRAHRTQRRLRTETPRPHELEHLLHDPQGVHSPGPYLRTERTVSLEESWARLPPPHELPGLFHPLT